MRRMLLVSTLLLLPLNGCSCDGANNSAADAGMEDLGDSGTTPDASPDGGDTGAPVLCGDDGVVTGEVAGWTVRLDANDGHWEVEAADGTLLRGPAACEATAIRVGEGSPLEKSAFANFQFDFEELVEWSDNAPGVPDWSEDEDGVLLTYDLADGSTAGVRFDADEQGNLRVVMQSSQPTGELRFDCEEGESFFGLGTQVTGMDLRGRSYPLWTQEQGNSKPESGVPYPLSNIPEAAYAPMGVWHSTRGYSALVTHDALTEIDLCETDAATLALRSHPVMPGFVALTGTPKERMTGVTEYVGRVQPDLPDWTFGLWLNAVTGPDRLSEVRTALRDNGIPASAIWSEDWIGGESGPFGFRLSYDWVWDVETYPNLPDTIDAMHDEGFAFLAYFNPFIPDTTSTWAEAIANGYAIVDADGEVITFQDPGFRTATLADLFLPETLAWLAGYQRDAVVEVGVDGWMADFAEWYPVEATDGWMRHNRYPLVWQQANRDNLAAAKEEIGDAGNYVFFVRSGWASVNGGTAGIAPTMWGGDQNTTWGYGDGFPTIVPIGAHVGLSGVGVFGSDIAGYNSALQVPNTGKDLWFRWSSAGAFHPLMRTHHGGDECANWNFDRDAESIDHMRRYSTIHSLLFPEFQRLLDESSALGWPITRHPWLVEPDVPALWSGDQYQWFLGDDILIAPVLTEGATTRDVTLPTAGWWPLLGDEATTSDAPTVDASRTEVPVFVRPGRALTLLAEAPDSFYGADVAGVTDLADVAGRYRVALYPNDAGEASSAGETPFAVGGRGLDTFEPSMATFNNVGLPMCPVDPAESCYTAETVLLVGAMSGTVGLGSASVDIDSPTPIDVEIGIAGAAWGTLADPTTFTPNPDAPTWCTEE